MLQQLQKQVSILTCPNRQQQHPFEGFVGKRKTKYGQIESSGKCVATANTANNYTSTWLNHMIWLPQETQTTSTRIIEKS